MVLHKFMEEEGKDIVRTYNKLKQIRYKHDFEELKDHTIQAI